MRQAVTEKGETIIETRHPDEVPDAAAKVLEICNSRRIFAIFGTMGAGKTTLIKALCALLGSGDVVKSPTFSIVNEYESLNGSLYHFDFYRIESLAEVFDIGFEEYIASGNYCFLEWPELIEPLIPEDAVEIRITVTGAEERTIKIAMR
jgi:tRNA threonylcarbamoyladenosine biosynthesis protein TsaE